MASLKEKRAALVKQLEEKQGLLAAGKADGDTIAFVRSALAEVEGIDRQLDGMKQSDDLLAQIGISAHFYQMLPYLITIIVLAFTSKSSRAPKAEGIPYDKGPAKTTICVPKTRAQLLFRAAAPFLA